MTEIERLNQLESQKAITIGLHRNAANNFWASTSLIGKTLNIATLGLIVFVIYTFYMWGWRIGFLAIIGLVVHVKMVQRICLTSVRIHMLQNQELFDSFYNAGAATVRVNATGEIIRYPEDWRQALS